MLYTCIKGFFMAIWNTIIFAIFIECKKILLKKVYGHTVYSSFSNSRLFLEAKVTEPNKRGNIGLFRQRSSFNGSVLNGISLKSKYQMLLLAISLSQKYPTKKIVLKSKDWISKHKTQSIKWAKNDIKLVSRNAAAL